MEINKTFKTTAAIFLILVLLTGCATPAPTNSTLKIATATAGGVWNPIGIALAKLISGSVPGEVAEAQETAGAPENLKLLTSGKSELIFAYDYHIAWLNQGKMADIAAGSQPARIALGLYEHPLHIIARADAGIQSLPELKGKRVSTGAAGSGAEEQAGYVLQALGLDWDKDITRQKLSLNDSIVALKAGSLDAFFWSGAVPSEAAPTKLVELASDPSLKIVFLPLDGQFAESVLQQTPGVFHRTSIKAGEYPGLEKDVETLGVTAVLAVMDNFSSSRLTSILAAIFAHKADLLVPVWKGAASLTPEKSLAVLAPETHQYLHPATQAYLQQRETLYQLSSINSLFSGHYDGFETVGWLKQHGDLGIGTFDELNGEMIVIDGQVYQALADGSLKKPDDATLVPFANVSSFDSDLSADLGQVDSFAALQDALVKMMPRKDSFYAIRVDATFKQLKVRTVARQSKPYLPLEEVLKKPVFFEYENVKGSVVGFWSPDYVGKINLPGYNLHFISDDRTIGGHLVEAVMTSVHLSLDETRYFEVKLNPLGE
ncbi:MAG: acetolactate decarboxylase [Chloroflexi bacterium]|nr:acetolactate decarboxylase [Chloroflexota bacterium]